MAVECLLRAASFDHLVGAAEQRERHGDAEGFGCLEVDEQLDFRDLLDRQISRLVALEDASGIDASLTVRLHKTACRNSSGRRR